MFSSLTEILAPERVLCREPCGSKKRALELIARLAADSVPELDEDELLTSLNARERLGSTGLGDGIAIPHCRLPHCERAVAALLTLEAPIDFASIDEKPVDLVFALMVPEDATDEHLELLGRLARLFVETDLCRALRRSRDRDELYERMLDAWARTD